MGKVYFLFLENVYMYVYYSVFVLNLYVWNMFLSIKIVWCRYKIVFDVYFRFSRLVLKRYILVDECFYY